jgi:starch-binding outer membrane protein, SusD/RagB family
MKTCRNILSFFFIFSAFAFSLSCKKFLEAKSNKQLSTPSTLEGLQAILDYPDLYLCTVGNNIASDEYYLNYSDWDGLDELNKAAYVWEPNTENNYDWTLHYRHINYVNTVLDGIKSVPSEGQVSKWKEIKGSALFLRAFYMFQLAEIFARQYDENSAESDLGIPLRLTSDFNEPTVRSSVKQTYDRIIQDIEDALLLLPDIGLYKTRPCRASAYGLLARIYLQMGDYEKAKSNASNSLQLIDDLIDYDTLNAADEYPIKKFNVETVFHATTSVPVNSYGWLAKIDSNLYRSFTSNDLRKSVFFYDNGDGTFAFKGTYTGNYDLLNGIATDEMFLTRAECNARQGNTSTAIQDLNMLLSKRWANGTFIPYTANSSDEALKLILEERKKELIYRGTRWSDLRRLNMNPDFSEHLNRQLNGQPYSLSPNDLRYTYLIPFIVIEITGVQQNPR